MIRKVLHACLGLMLGVLIASGQENAQPGEESYESLVEKLKKFDRSVDFTTLRQAYVKSTDYSPYGGTTDKPHRAMFEAFNKKQYDKAIKEAEKVLKEYYLDIDAHIICQLGFAETGERERAEYHKFVSQGLVRSIMDSGDGESEATAYKVVTVDEEYAILRIRGYGFRGQGLRHNDGHSYDVMTVMNPETSQEEELYFNIDPIFGYWGRLFGGEKDKK